MVMRTRLPRLRFWLNAAALLTHRHCHCYLQVMRETQGALLPKFTAEESKLLRSTTVDFFSVNFYCGYYVWAPAPGSPKELVSLLLCYVFHSVSSRF
jgi:beta-glucosidase/6-phospho-beta-glucosidase/beta-galactosidase